MRFSPLGRLGSWTKLLYNNKNEADESNEKEKRETDLTRR